MAAEYFTDKARAQAETLLKKVKKVSSANITNQLLALKEIKNGIIGNRTKKNLYVNLGIISLLVEILDRKDAEITSLKTQASIILGSLANGSEDIIKELSSKNVMISLLNCINLEECPLELIEASARALKFLLQHQDVDSSPLYEEPYFNRIISLLKVGNNEEGSNKATPSLYTAELAALIFAKSCDNKDKQYSLTSTGIIEFLMSMLMTNSQKAQEASLSALSSLCKENMTSGKTIINYKTASKAPMIDILMGFVRSMNPSIQLAASGCITNLIKLEILKDSNKTIALIVLPILVKLLDVPGTVGIEAPLAISNLVMENEELQKVACDSDAISKLTNIISKIYNRDDQDNCLFEYQSNDKDKSEENSLIALATISSYNEECRQQVIKAKALPHIVSAMRHPKPGVRAAACQCARSLSRSVMNLRTALVEVGVADPLFRLLDDEDTNVQIAALAALCNIVLEFSPAKSSILENKGIDKLVALVHSDHSETSFNAVWALKNLAFQADKPVKLEIIEKLTHEKLYSLIKESEITVQEQATGLLRNLSCSNDEVVESLFNGIGQNRLISLLEEKLRIENNEIRQHILYTIVNISTGNTGQKAAIMDSTGILSLIKRNFTHSHDLVRVAACWCIINLSWIDEPSEECYKRIAKLKTLGFESALKSLEDDPFRDVRDRVKTALSHFHSESQAQQPYRSRFRLLNDASYPRRTLSDNDNQDS